MQQTVYFRDTSGIVHARARVSWDNGPTVTVNVEYNESNSWRIKPAGSNTTPVLTVTNGSTYGSFTATDGQTYVFQSVGNNGNWDNSRDGSGEFTVDFGGSSGGNTGGGTTGGGTTGGGTTGGGSTTTGGVHYLYVKQSEGVNISIKGMEETSSPGVFGPYDLEDWFEEEYNGSMWRGHEISADDYFSVSVEAAEGYELISKDILGLNYDEEYGIWEVDQYDIFVYIMAAAVPKVDGTFVLGNSSKSAKYRAYQFDGSVWKPLSSLGHVSRDVKTGTAILSAGNRTTVECDFSPDLVWFGILERYSDGRTVSFDTTAPFSFQDTDSVTTNIWIEEYSRNCYITVNRTENGFEIVADPLNGMEDITVEKEIQYTAIRYA